MLASLPLVMVPFLLLFLLVEGRWELLRRLDEGVARRLNDIAVSSDAMVSTLRLLNDVFSPTTFRVVALVLVVHLLRRLAVWVVITTGGSGLVDLVAKELTGRQRHPSTAEPGDSVIDEPGSLTGVRQRRQRRGHRPLVVVGDHLVHETAQAAGR